jgi:hypothetical protein
MVLLPLLAIDARGQADTAGMAVEPFTLPSADQPQGICGRYLYAGDTRGMEMSGGVRDTVPRLERSGIRAEIADPHFLFSSSSSENSSVPFSFRSALNKPFSLRFDDSASALYPFDGYDPDTTHINWTHTAIMAGALGITITGIHLYQMNAWWKDQRGPFHVVQDNTYALNVDKAGHFLGGAFSAFVGQKSLEWSGVSRNPSVIWGSVLGAMFELYVEVEDGFARDWGFSPGDAYGDIIGAAWMAGREFIPYMEHFQPKFSYFPSAKMRSGEHKGNALDDYEGQTYWMGIQVHGLLPECLKPYWPEWLGIAVGLAVRGMETNKEPERDVVISLDYDLTKIIPAKSWLMKTFVEALNFLHFPAPAIRISPNFIAYGLYFQ